MKFHTLPLPNCCYFLPLVWINDGEIENVQIIFGWYFGIILKPAMLKVWEFCITQSWLHRTHRSSNRVKYTFSTHLFPVLLFPWSEVRRPSSNNNVLIVFFSYFYLTIFLLFFLFSSEPWVCEPIAHWPCEVPAVYSHQRESPITESNR